MGLEAVDEFLLNMRMKPDWAVLDSLRDFIETFAGPACRGHQREQQVALAVHELMENAITAGGGAEVELRVLLSPAEDRIQVEVTNVCDEAAYCSLAKRVSKLNEDQSPLDAYLEQMRMQRAFERGGLGLPRIRFETQLELSVERESNRVRVRAQGKMRPSDLAKEAVTHA